MTYVESELIDLDKIVRLAQRARSTGDGDSKRRLHKLLQGLPRGRARVRDRHIRARPHELRLIT